MQTLNDWLIAAAKDLDNAGISTARLDAELILAHTLKKPRTWLHAHSDETFEPRQLEIANARLDLRSDRVPLAYITGHKEFYGRQFHVTTATLIPRPESEVLIEALAEIVPTLASPRPQLIDIGTGSGCLGITAKLEHPVLNVTLADIDHHALTVATKNAKQLHADVSIVQSDLLEAYPIRPHIIIANLPYVGIDWERSPETNHEPSLALFADNDGLSLITKLIDQASEALLPNGWLLLEADSRQLHAISHYASKHSFTTTKQDAFMVVLQKP